MNRHTIFTFAFLFLLLTSIFSYGLSAGVINNNVNQSTLLNYVPYSGATSNITLNSAANLIIPIQTKIVFKNSTGGNIQILNISSDTSNYLTLTGNFISTGTLRTDSDILTTGSGDNIWLGTSTENSALTWFNSSGAGTLSQLSIGYGNVSRSNRSSTLSVNGTANFQGNITAPNINYGLNQTFKIVCDVDLVALTKKYQNFTYTGGILTSNTTCT